MNKFVDRIEFQRKIIKLINSSRKYKYYINGLSKPSIYIWALKNRISIDDDIYTIVLHISDLISTLANHSQETISEENFNTNYKEDILNKLNIYLN